LTDVAEMHHGDWRTFDGGSIAGGSMHSFNLLDEELSKFVGVDVS